MWAQYQDDRLSSCLLDLLTEVVVILTLVELPQVLLLLLVHHDVDPGDGLAHHADLGELGSGTASHLQTTVRTAPEHNSEQSQDTGQEEIRV